MDKKTDAYVDTSAFISFADRSDTHHDLFLRAFADPPRLITSSLVVAEGHGWFLRRFGSFRALQFIAMMDSIEPLEVIAFGPAELPEAVSMLKKFNDQTLTLADAFGLSLMARRRVSSCWSTDFHLGLTGVPLLIHER
ncbi:MAG TPA: PIN domain-containing protein [Thermoanaerobaculia bacterium]|nr:PIN domain-containing protein [Thermoanaerobaculia bacterium]